MGARLLPEKSEPAWGILERMGTGDRLGSGGRMLSKVQEELKRAGVCLLFFVILLLGRRQLVGILRGKKIAMHGGIEKLRNAAGIAGLPQNPHELCDDGLSRHVIGLSLIHI